MSPELAIEKAVFTRIAQASSRASSTTGGTVAGVARSSAFRRSRRSQRTGFRDMGGTSPAKQILGLMKPSGFATKKQFAGMALSTVGAGLGGFAMYSKVTSDVRMHSQARTMMRSALRHGGGNREADFSFNPMMNFSRPRVRGGHLGTAGLTLALNSQRSSR